MRTYQMNKATTSVVTLSSWVAMLIALIGLITVPFAKWAPMGNSEIYVLEIARQPDLTTIWSVLRAGADNHPPMDYWLRHLSMSFFGSSSLAFRLPSLIAIWTSAIFLFLLLCRRGDPMYGASAVLLMLLLWGQSLAANDRGYALLLCSFSISLYAWDGFEAQPSSIWREGLFALSLLLAVYSHYYGVLFFIAYALAALVRSLMDRRLWIRPFVLLAGTAVGCIPLWTLAEVASQYRTNFWTPVDLTAALNFYAMLLSPVLTAFVVMTVLLSIALVGSTRGEWPGRLPLSRTSILAIGMFSFQPISLFLIAKLLTGAFNPGYAAEAGVAFCLLFVVLAANLSPSPRWRAVIFVGVPMVFLTISTARLARSLTFSYREDFVKALAQLQKTINLPVVLGDDGLFVELAYAYPAVLKNCYFLYDAFPHDRTNVDLAVRGLQQVMPLQAETYDAMKTAHREFLFIGTAGNAVLKRAVADGGTVVYHPAPSATDYWTVSIGEK
jgi:hypothetical protein